VSVAQGLGTRSVLRSLLGNAGFTVVSNNCWGAHLYRNLGLAYATPFVGLFIPPKSYLALLSRFDEMMTLEPAFVQASREARFNEWRARQALAYPIGVLGDSVEIHFMHYKDAAEATEKWRRRRARMVADPRRRFFKFDDRDGATPGDIVDFCGLPFANKVCFTAARHAVDTVIVPAEPGESNVPDGERLAGFSRRYFNAFRWLSERPRWLPLPSVI
jgi:uncharacterized protein (DUF1919 family)